MSTRNLIVVSGVNMRPATRLFRNADTADMLTIDGTTYELNAAAGAAVELCKRGRYVWWAVTHATWS